MSDIDWRDVTSDYTPQSQEQNVETTQELPAVSKLKEAFDTARNALIEGSELAKQVQEMKGAVASLTSEVSELHRDLEYVRNRNRELDEQVTQVRQARDQAIADSQALSDRAIKAEATIASLEDNLKWMSERINVQARALDDAKKERDDAMSMALEYEGKLKTAEARLAQVAKLMSDVASVTRADETTQDKPKPHYVDQPRDEVGKFQPTAYDRGSQSEGLGF